MKVTLAVLILTIVTYTSCKSFDDRNQISLQQSMDSIASDKIDSAYLQIQQQCDTAFKYRLPVMVDSLLKIDSAE